MQERGVRVDGQEHPEERGCGVDKHADQIADFEAGDIVGGAAVVDDGVVADLQDAKTGFVIAAVEVLVDGLVELPAAREALARCVFWI